MLILTIKFALLNLTTRERERDEKDLKKIWKGFETEAQTSPTLTQHTLIREVLTLQVENDENR